MPSPTVGLVIPVYTELRFLLSLIESLVAQIDHIDQLVFVDDQNTSDIAQCLSESLIRFNGKAQVISNASPQGIAISTKIALAACATDYVGFVDSDDVLLPEAMATMRKTIDANPGVALISSRFSFWDGKSKRGIPNRGPETSVATQSWSEFMISDNRISHFKVVSRDMVERIAWEPSIDGVQDAVLNFSLSSKDDVILLPQVLYLHRVHANQHSNTLSSLAARHLNSARRAWLSETYGPQGPDEVVRLMSSVGSFERVSRALSDSFLAELHSDGSAQAVPYFNLIGAGESLTGRDLIVRLSDRSFGLTRQIVRIILLRPRSLSFYLESSNPQSWHMAKVFSGAFSCLFLDNALLLPALSPAVPDSVPIVVPHELDQIVHGDF
jgi:GT2 family glycosyltransferase